MASAKKNVELAEAGRLVARKLIQLYEREGGEVTPWSVRWMHDQIMKLSLDLDRETIQEAKQTNGLDLAAHLGGAKPTASVFLIGVAEALENYFEAPEDST